MFNYKEFYIPMNLSSEKELNQQKYKLFTTLQQNLRQGFHWMTVWKKDPWDALVRSVFHVDILETLVILDTEKAFLQVRNGGSKRIDFTGLKPLIMTKLRSIVLPNWWLDSRSHLSYYRKLWMLILTNAGKSFKRLLKN